MRATGMVRKIDTYGRIVVPKEIRDMLNFEEESDIEMLIDQGNKRLILEKYHRGCIFCGEIENTKKFKDKVICEDCADQFCEDHYNTNK